MDINHEILKLCSDKKVLHLGPLGDYKRHISSTSTTQDWFFYRVSKIASQVLGVDINREGVEEVRGVGFSNIVFGDAENLNLGEKFDVILAGDVIEHLNNVGKFLESCKFHMHHDSRLIITTPNPYSLTQILKAIFGDAGRGMNQDHTFLFHQKNIEQLLKRYNLKLTEVKFCTVMDSRSFRTNFISLLLNFLGFFKTSYHRSYYFLIEPVNK